MQRKQNRQNNFLKAHNKKTYTVKFQNIPQSYSNEDSVILA